MYYRSRRLSVSQWDLTDARDNDGIAKIPQRWVVVSDPALEGISRRLTKGSIDGIERGVDLLADLNGQRRDEVSIYVPT